MKDKEILDPAHQPMGFQRAGEEDRDILEDAGLNREYLTLKQWRFVREFIKSGNQTQAAINAGYGKAGAASRASELIRKPKIQAAIQKEVERQGIIGGEILTPDEVLINLTDIAMNPASSEPARLKALELLGKRYQLFTDKGDSGETKIVLNLEAPQDKE